MKPLNVFKLKLEDFVAFTDEINKSIQTKDIEIMNTELFTVVTWPQVQVLMDREGFDRNAVLINEEPFLTEYGSSAYLIRNSWLRQNKDENLERS